MGKPKVINRPKPKSNLKTDVRNGTRCGLPICGVRKKNGETCCAFAGLGTGHLGIGKCKWHGGSTRSHQTHAVRTAAAQRAATLGVPIEVDPGSALLWTVHASAGHATWLREQVAEIEGTGTFEARVLVEMYGNERDRLTRASKAALDAGIDERRVRIAEQHGDRLVAAIRRAIISVELPPDAAQKLNKAIAREIRDAIEP
jgi:hypothetical protein